MMWYNLYTYFLGGNMVDREAMISEEYMRRIVALEKATLSAAKSKREVVAIRLAFDGMTLACRARCFAQLGQMLKTAGQELRASAKVTDQTDDA